MIAKPFASTGESTDPRQRAGQDAERRMAHYMQRAFATDPALHVLHNLRLEDPEQPEPGGSPGACQIDHLVVHDRGMFIVESKSVSGVLRVRPDRSGGDEWSRVWRGREDGMRSPIQQAQLQADFLREILQRHRAELLARATGIQGAAMRLLAQTDQRGFRRMPIQLIVAISDAGRIERLKGWKEPTEPLRVFVCKADQVAEKIRSELATHGAHGGLLQEEKGAYGIWRIKPEEVQAVTAFLMRRHTPPPRGVRKQDVPNSAARRTLHVAACKHCCGTDLRAQHGKFGYYWKCAACGTNTAMPAVCSACGASARSGQGVRIRKLGSIYDRVCDACGVEERLWVEAGASQKGEHE